MNEITKPDPYGLRESGSIAPLFYKRSSVAQVVVRSTSTTNLETRTISSC
jgi:hypothetical protein